MAFHYLQSKGTGRGHCHKTKREKALSGEQLQAMLKACEESANEFNEHWKRDHAAIYLAYMLGLRVGEVALLERHHARELLKGDDTMWVPTLKQSDKIPYRCKGTLQTTGQPCGRAVRLRWDMGGQKHTCSKCDTSGLVPIPKDKLNTGVIEKDPGFVEERTIKYILGYIKNDMRPDQRWFFESRTPGCHVSESYLSRIFYTFAAKARGEDGKPCISGKFSFHSLRHGRGVVLYSQTQELEAVREGLRHKNLKTTEIYIGLDAEVKEKFRRKLNRIAFDPWKRVKKRA